MLNWEFFHREIPLSIHFGDNLKPKGVALHNSAIITVIVSWQRC